MEEQTTPEAAPEKETLDSINQLYSKNCAVLGDKMFKIELLKAETDAIQQILYDLDQRARKLREPKLEEVK